MKKTRVTPEMAQAWLAGQANNRKPSDRTIAKYALAMKQSTWIADPRMPLSFDEDGRLADGQHRLFAVIEHGEPVDFYIATVSKDVLDLMHECKPRNLADRLMMGDGFDATDARAIAALGVIIATRVEMNRLPCSSQRMGVAYRTYRPDEIADAFTWAKCDPIDVTREARALYAIQPAKFRLISASLIGYLLAQQAPKVAAFIQQIVADEHPNRCASAVAFRRQLGNSNYSQSHRLALLSRAYNSQDAKLLRAGDEVEDLDGGCFPIL